MPGQRGLETVRDLFARADWCRSLETCLPGQRGVEAWRPSACQGRGVWKLGDLQLARAEGCRSLETCLPGQRGVETFRDLFARADWCRSLETCLPGQRGVEAWRPSACQGRGVWKLGDLQFARAEGTRS